MGWGTNLIFEMKLLNRSIQSYLFYSIGILIISLPIFYFAIKYRIDQDVDNSLKAQRTEIITRLDRIANQDPFALLDLFGQDIMLNRIRIFQTYDTLYTVRKPDPVSGLPISYRILESNVLIRGVPYKIVLQNSLVSSEDLIKSIVLIMLVLLVVIVGGMLIINRKISGKLWKPFYATLQYLRDFRVDGDNKVSLPLTDIEEFSDLNKAATSLTTTNQKLFFSQKEFTENASHEMQTPLAVLQSKIELLMQTNPLSEEQATLITEMADASQRMYRLNKSLLLLTKIDNSQFTEKETLSVSSLVTRIEKQYQPLATQKNILMNVDLAEDVKVTTNGTLLEIMVGNLLNNAIRHNVDNGIIKIRLQGGKLTVQNSGRKSPLDKEKVFTRFHKESTDSNSIGLGLEIVRKICALSNYSIDYGFVDNLHTFTVTFRN